MSLEDQEQMIALANKVINQGLSVRATEEAAKPVVGKATIRPGKRQESLKVLAEKIGDKLNTSVRIKMGLRKGTIEIDFASIDDMKRILKDLGQDTDF
ncbi:MAG: hypothetical protein EB055_02255 [Micrococcales bacterium]|nr:hypothetical protein [Micrococcales bacterium]